MYAYTYTHTRDTHMCHGAHVNIRGKLAGSTFFSFYHVDPKDLTQIIRCVVMYLCPLCHLAGSKNGISVSVP